MILINTNSVEEQLKQSSETLIDTLNNFLDGIFLLDNNWNFTYLNNRAAAIVGLKPQDIVGKNLWKDFPQVKGTALEENYLLAMKNQEIRHFEVAGIGTSIWFEIIVYPSKEGIIVHWRDITERKKIENDLRKSEQQFLALVKAGSSGSNVVYRMSADWTEMRTLEGQNFLVDTNEPNKSWLAKYIPDVDKEIVIRTISEAVETKKVFELEHRVIQVDGSVGWTYSRAIPILDKDGEIVEWLGVAANITKRKKIEEELKQTKVKLQEYTSSLERQVEKRSKQVAVERERFFNMLENLPVMVCLITADYKIPFANRMFRGEIRRSKG